LWVRIALDSVVSFAGGTWARTRLGSRWMLGESGSSRLGRVGPWYRSIERPSIEAQVLGSRKSTQRPRSPDSRDGAGAGSTIRCHAVASPPQQGRVCRCCRCRPVTCCDLFTALHGRHPTGPPCPQNVSNPVTNPVSSPPTAANALLVELADIVYTLGSPIR